MSAASNAGQSIERIWLAFMVSDDTLAAAR